MRFFTKLKHRFRQLRCRNAQNNDFELVRTPHSDPLKMRNVAQVVEQKRRLRKLPPEIVLVIIRLSLPPPGTSYPARYAQLRTFSLVCRSWSKLAQYELFRHVQLKDADKFDKFHASVQVGGDGELAKALVSLRLEKGRPTQALQLFFACHQLRFLWLKDLHPTLSTLSVAVGELLGLDRALCLMLTLCLSYRSRDTLHRQL